MYVPSGPRTLVQGWFPSLTNPSGGSRLRRVASARSYWNAGTPPGPKTVDYRATHRLSPVTALTYTSWPLTSVMTHGWLSPFRYLRRTARKDTVLLT